MLKLRGLSRLLIVQAKLFLREPLAVFFTLLMAPMLLVLMGFIFGNEPDPLLGGRGALDVGLPGYAAMVIGIVGLVASAVETSTRREMGVLRRFRASPLRPLTYIVADVTVYFAMTLLGVGLLFLLGTLAYGVRFEGNPWTVFVGVFLSTGAMLSLGYLLAGLAPNARVATLVGNVALYPMLVLSGAVVPMQVMPEGVQSVARFIPLTHAVRLLRGLWTGEALGAHPVELAVLAGVMLTGTALAAWTFRWE